MEFTARELAQILNGTVDGNPEARATSFAKIEHGKEGQLCFFANPKYEKYVYTSKASLLLVNADFSPKEPVAPTMIRVENAYTSLAQLLKYVSDQRKAYRRHRAWSASIAFSAKIGKKVSIGAHSTVGGKCRIGDFCIIHDNVSIGEGTVIGHHCIIYPGVRIYPGMVIGDRVILHAGAVIGSDGFGNAPQSDGTWKKIEHLGNVIIGNDVEIGANTTVDRAEMESTIIGNGVKIDNLCQIAHNVQIGDNTVMAALSGIAGSTKIGKNCILAGQVGIVGHLTIADNTTVCAKAGVIGNIRKSGQVWMGSPAILHGTFLRSYAAFKHSGEEQK
ncbi:MAG: UDP-3-O-(3-hydroxymyristoyl)glucosamine N-acyltransferase [Bacteroidia bacterium]|nr:UDP-3-O-(3-hydroxymyristoyl)glucosamine N-acyltransferase [Bacteroidia bacterium]